MSTPVLRPGLWIRGYEYNGQTYEMYDIFDAEIVSIDSEAGTLVVMGEGCDPECDGLVISASAIEWVQRKAFYYADFGKGTPV